MTRRYSFLGAPVATAADGRSNFKAVRIREGGKDAILHVGDACKVASNETPFLLGMCTGLFVTKDNRPMILMRWFFSASEVVVGIPAAQRRVSECVPVALAPDLLRILTSRTARRARC